MSETEQLLCELIALPSVNPAFPAKASQTGERRVAEFLAQKAACAGLDIQFQPVLPDRSNMIATLRASKKPKQRIVLAPHMDTVGAASENQFTPVRKNGRIYGRGACDTKGSIAAFITALSTIAKGPSRPSETEIVFVGLADEETAQTGSRVLAKSGFKADFAIVGEPTRLQVVTAHKGSVWLELEARGKAAHGSKPELGRNAVHLMARVVDLIETTYASNLKARRPHKLLGNGTVNIGSIRGGSQPNIVPDLCTAKLDRRTLPGETEKTVRKELAALLKRQNLGAKLTNAKDATCLPLETDVDLPWVQQLLKCARRQKPVGVDYFCDASVLAQAGIPSVAFGPGDIAQAHTANEWISLRELERSTAILVEFLRSLP